MIRRPPKYRIIKLDRICPWQVQERRWLFFWRDVCGNVSSIRTAEQELTARVNRDRMEKVLKPRKKPLKP